MDRSQKEKAVADFKSIFEEAEAIIVAHYAGINADSINELRSKTRNSNVTFRVTKNRLVKIALENSSYKNLSELFSGPTAITYSKDVVAAAKVTTSFAKENEKLIVIGGALKDKVLDLDAIKHLASLPSLSELQAKIIGLISAPARQIVTVLSTPSRQLVTVTKSYEGVKEESPKEETTPKEEAVKEEAAPKEETTPKEEAVKEEAAPKEEAVKEEAAPKEETTPKEEAAKE